VYRASLPYSEIEQLNSLKVKYATVINVMLFGPQDPVAMKEAIEKELRSETGYPDSVVFAEYKVTVDDKHTEILTSKLSSQSWEGNKVSSTSSVNFLLSYP